MKNTRRSLSDLLGKDYITAVCRANSFLTGRDYADMLQIAEEQVDFFPEQWQARLDEMLEKVGTRVCEGLSCNQNGAPTDSFSKAQHDEMSPLSGAGFIRVGEDGRAYFIGKSEHYHASLGHCFPGYRLLEKAREIGICNITHNNTRGYITRFLERELIRLANGLQKEDRQGVDSVFSSETPHTLNRVINLETGSLAVEAALKMMLARFYRLDETFPEPAYSDRTPVFLVMADFSGGPKANYHGTTVLTQILRGMWPQLAGTLEKNDQYRFCPVKINDLDDFKAAIDRYDNGKFKIAGFFHELVLMNYGGVKLDKDYIQSAHRLCHKNDIPVAADEIQSCLWSPELFMFREYELNPDFVAIGKGFPGGQYAASKIITTAEMDTLNQFGALVTNGQEELASLAYLITMEFAAENAGITRRTGEHYHGEAEKLAKKYSGIIDQIEGSGHMTTFFFKKVDDAVSFAEFLNHKCAIDVGVQTYKPNCPPAAITKLPLISSQRAVDFVISRMETALKRFA